MWLALALGLGVSAVLYAAVVAALAAGGRRAEAVALARFGPDCAVLFARLARDPAVPRRRKLIFAGLGAYLASPIDLVPDFVPVAGHLDDVVVVGLALRWLLRGAGPDLVGRHWPGPEESLAALLRLAGVGTATGAGWSRPPSGARLRRPRRPSSRPREPAARRWRPAP